MASSFIPRSDAALVIWFNNFAAELAAHVGQCGITATDVGSAQKDAAAVEAVVNCQAQWKAFRESFTVFKDDVIDGLPGDPATPLAWPVPPPLPDPLPALVAAGAKKRAQKLADKIKDGPGYSPSIGEALGIIAPEGEEERPEDMQPRLEADGFDVSHPMLRCSRGKAQRTEVEGDHADGKGWVHVDTIRSTRLTDQFPLPPAGTAQVWRYRAIYRDADGRVGQWSEVLSVTVTGA